jgi:apolipoprotein N-acyltransferase
MKFLSTAKSKLPKPVNILLAVFSAILLILAFPDFEFWFLAWFALIPLFFAVEREKESLLKSGFTGWIFGTTFFFGSCWWLTFAPITYAGFPPVLAYFLLFCAASIVGLFPALFSLLLSFLLKRFGSYAILSAPFLWTAIEFLRFWTTGNNWNAVGYSQAFNESILRYAAIGGILLVSFLVILSNTFIVWLYRFLKKEFGEGIFASYFPNGLSYPFYIPPKDDLMQKIVTKRQQLIIVVAFFLIFFAGFLNVLVSENFSPSKPFMPYSEFVSVIAIQPNVPMSGLTEKDREILLERHVELTQNAIQNSNFSGFLEEQIKLYSKPENVEQQKQFYASLAAEKFLQSPKIVIFPESPMNFMYERDREFQAFIREFASRNNVSVLFNAAEPDAESERFFNSAVMVDTEGRKIAQYDKIYLVPFGETVPAPLQSIMPALVGSFSVGKDYDLLPFGEATGGVMICFESHFPNLAREYVKNGADVLVELTNDGYLGKTPVLRQHLANAVFRAVETNRPVLRVTNVGITAYVNERGEVLDASESYTEDTRIWTIAKSDGSQTFYVKYGDWFAWFLKYFLKSNFLRILAALRLCVKNI